MKMYTSKCRLIEASQHNIFCSNVCGECIYFFRGVCSGSGIEAKPETVNYAKRKTKIRKIALVKFPTISNYRITRVPSLALGYLSKVLSEKKFDTTAIDCNLIFSKGELYDEEKTLSDLINIVKKINPDAICISTLSDEIPIAFEFIRRYKRLVPDIIIIMGGQTATFLSSFMLNIRPEIDFIVRGEGEKTVLELINSLNSGKLPEKGCSFVKRNRIVHTSEQKPVRDLGELPIIDLEEFYFIPKNCVFSLQFCRGCVGNCVFCNVHNMWGKPRYFPVDHCIKQIRTIEDRFPSFRYMFNDDSLTSDPKQFIKLATRFHDEFPDIGFRFLSRVDCLSKEVISVAKKTTEGIYIGVESILPHSLKFMNKTQHPSRYIEKFHKLLPIFHESGIEIKLAFLLGLPVEDKKDMLRLKSYILDISKKYDNIHYQIGPVIVYPGTRLFDMFVEKEIELYKLSSPSHLFFNRYSYIPYLVPSLYGIYNEKIPNYDNFLRKILNDLWSHPKHKWI